MTSSLVFIAIFALTFRRTETVSVHESVSVIYVYVTGKMSWGHTTPVRMVGRLDWLLKCCIKFFGNEFSDLLETVFGGREFHSLIVVGKKLFPNMFAEYLICKN